MLYKQKTQRRKKKKKKKKKRKLGGGGYGGLHHLSPLIFTLNPSAFVIFAFFAGNPPRLALSAPESSHFSLSLRLSTGVIDSQEMPKEKSSRSSDSHKSKPYSYKPYSGYEKRPAVFQDGILNEEDSAGRKDWEDAICPICMDFPHNAILLLCSSHDKGCRPYICDTSYRHSNCFDQYRKAYTASEKASSSIDASNFRLTPRSDGVERNSSVTMIGRPGRGPSSGSGSEHEPPFLMGGLEDSGHTEGLGLSRGAAHRASALEKRGSLDLLCPLCRGKVDGWKVVQRARQFLNRKIRSCAREACSFAGTYEELRIHARGEHPLARPSEIDPIRQRDWRRLERQRDLGDVLSTIRSAMPGATVLGDYAIEGQDDDYENENDESDFPGDDGHWWTVFLLFRVFGPSTSISGGRVIPSRLRGFSRGHHRSGSLRHGLWGENLRSGGGSVGNSSSGSSDTGEQVAGTFRRRHMSHHRDEDD